MGSKKTRSHVVVTLPNEPQHEFSHWVQLWWVHFLYRTKKKKTVLEPKTNKIRGENTQDGFLDNLDSSSTRLKSGIQFSCNKSTTKGLNSSNHVTNNSFTNSFDLGSFSSSEEDLKQQIRNKSREGNQNQRRQPFTTEPSDPELARVDRDFLWFKKDRRIDQLPWYVHI